MVWLIRTKNQRRIGITGAGYIVSGYSGGVAVKGSIVVGQSLAKLS